VEEKDGGLLHPSQFLHTVLQLRSMIGAIAIFAGALSISVGIPQGTCRLPMQVVELSSNHPWARLNPQMFAGNVVA